MNSSYSLQVLSFVFVCLVLLRVPGLFLVRLFVDRDADGLLVVLDSLVVLVVSLLLQAHRFSLLLVVRDVRVPVIDRVRVDSPNILIFLLFTGFCVFP